MAYIKLIEPSGKAYYINCSQIPPENGPGILEIQNVERKTAEDENNQPYKFLSIPCSIDPPGEEPVFVIRLQADLSPDNMVLPYNGGSPFQEISVKYE